MEYNDTQLILAQSLLNNGRFRDALIILETLVDEHYLPAYPIYLWAIWGDGNYYQRFIDAIEDGIHRGSLDCQYIKLWKDFANRPAVDEYWTEIDRLAMLEQKNALLAAGLNEYLYGDKVSSVRMICQAHPCRSSVEVLSYIYKFGRPEHKRIITELIGTFKLADEPAIPFESYPYPYKNECPVQNYLNAELTNEEFNATVFTQLRMMERKRIEKNGALSYSDIKDVIVTNLPDGICMMEGLTKNSWSLDDYEQSEAENRHSVYLMKRLDDGKWMTLRIGDHTSNIGDYYKYRRMYVPSSRPYANLCIMFHGDREQNAQLSYALRFRRKTADPCVTVRDEDFQVYRPFYYTLMHYVPGLITDIQPLIEAIRDWFNGDGNEPFQDPYYTLYDEVAGISNDGPSARLNGGLVTIETWDIKYNRRKKEAEEKKSD